MSVVADNKIFTPFGIDNVTVYRYVVNDILVCDQFLSAVPALEEHAKYNTGLAVFIIYAFKHLSLTHTRMDKSSFHEPYSLYRIC